MTLIRRATVEAVGTALLVAIVVGSGISAQRLSPHDIGLQLLENSNPAVTIGRTLTNTFAGIKPSSAPAFIAAQIVGALAAIGLARYLHPNEPAARRWRWGSEAH